MIPDNVTLVVKAPNQQIEDQNVDCLSSWTVRQLKGHLSDVYPSKPTADEQKIIYSGQLLEDSAILKDVLRTYENELNHTMHLVCTPRRRIMEPTRPIEQPVPSTDGLRRRNIDPVTPVNDTLDDTVNRQGDTANRQADTANRQADTANRQADTANRQADTTNRQADTVNRQADTVNQTNRPETRQNDQNREIEMQNFLSSFGNNYGRVPPYPTAYNMGLPNAMPTDPTLMANHMLMMQQAYMQYMQQYANMWQAGAQAGVNVAPTPAPNPQPAAPAAQPNPPPQQPVADLDEDGVPRDWLEHLYAACRLAILVSLVYAYSSPARLLTVLVLIAVYYAHQVGLFREVPVNNQPQEPPQPQNQAEPQNPAENNENQEENREPVINNAPLPEVDQQSFLAVTWMVVTTFFSSLIPELNQ